jgi:hypothetical protein
MSMVMESTRTIQGIKQEPKTSPPTATESALSQLFDPLTDDRANQIAGMIVRSCIIVARCERSEGEHHTRIKRAAETFATMTVADTWTTGPEDVIPKVAAILKEVTSEEFPVAQFCTSVSFDGTEGPRLVFRQAVDSDRASLPA